MVLLNLKFPLGAGIFTTMLLKISVFWDKETRNPVKVNCCFKGTCRLHLHVSFLLVLSLKATCSSETSVGFQRRYTPEGGILAECSSFNCRQFFLLWGLTACLYVYHICVFFRAIRNFSRVSTVGIFKTAYTKARHCTLADHYKFLRFHGMKTHRGLLLHDIVRN
jgi:hypothetical protein